MILLNIMVKWLWHLQAFLPLLTVAVVGIVNTKTTTAVENISYEKQITDAIEGAGND